MNDIKIPQINFIPLKQGITEDELNEYMVNSATCGFDDGIVWLNDWDEGQQDVEYLAITNIGD